MKVSVALVVGSVPELGLVDGIAILLREDELIDGAADLGGEFGEQETPALVVAVLGGEGVQTGVDIFGASLGIAFCMLFGKCKGALVRLGFGLEAVRIGTATL